MITEIYIGILLYIFIGYLMSNLSLILFKVKKQDPVTVLVGIVWPIFVCIFLGLAFYYTITYPFTLSGKKND